MGPTERVTYCANCGAIAGHESKCPATHTGQHSLTTTEKPIDRVIVCKNCAKTPGSATRCPGSHTGQHSFTLT